MMRAFISGLRYALIPPTAILSWFVVFLLGVFTESSVSRFYCPEGFAHGAHCSSPYAETVRFFIMHLFAGISALAVVAASVILAPSHKFRCGLIAYVLGAMVAAVMAFEFGWTFWFSAILIGSLPLIALKRRERTARVLRK